MKQSYEQYFYMKLNPDRIKDWQSAKQLVKLYPKEYKFEMKQDKNFTSVYLWHKQNSVNSKIITSFMWHRK